MRKLDLGLILELSAQVLRARSLDEIHETALDAVLETVSTDMAAFLLVDEDGNMRFCASRGLSEEYRSSVEGHSPWDPDDLDPRMVVVPDVSEDESLAPLGSVLAAERISALCFMPLVYERRLLGKFVIYFRDPHSFSENELELAGTVANLVGFAVARKRFEDALRESEERFRLAADAAHAMVYDVRLEEETAVVLGSSRLLGEEIVRPVGREWWCRRVHPDDGEHCRKQYAEALRDRDEFSIEYQVRHRDGHYHVVEDHGRVVRDERGEPVRVVGAVVDVTDRRRAEEVLRDSEIRLRRLAESIPHIVWSAGADASWDFVNRRWEEFTGQPPETAVGRGWKDFLHPDDAERTEAALAAFGSRDRFQVDHRLRGRDGVYEWFLSRAEVVSEGDAVVRWYGTCTNIHERKEAEKKLRIQARKLEEVDQHKNEFLAVLGHELRNPVAGIASGLRLAQLDLGPERKEWAFNLMNEQIRQLVRILDDLLDLSRISRGKIVLRRKNVRLSSIVGRALRALTIDVQRREIRAETQEDVVVLADPVRLEQVITNLVTNALKYTPEGGRIEVFAGREESRAVIRVRDTGIGVDENEQEVIFEPFTQIRSQSGLGMGLTLVKKLVELHGGTVSVSSEGRGKGSEFTVSLPLSTAAPVEGIDDSSKAAARTRGTRVLLVDDSAMLADALSALLRHEGGCDVRTAYDGRSALEVAGSHRPQAILVDLGLPDISGCDLARRFRADRNLRGSLLIAVSGYGHEDAREAAREAGFDYYVAKPASSVELLSLIGRRGGGPPDGPSCWAP